MKPLRGYLAGSGQQSHLSLLRWQRGILQKSQARYGELKSREMKQKTRLQREIWQQRELRQKKEIGLKRGMSLPEKKAEGRAPQQGRRSSGAVKHTGLSA